MSTIPKLFLDRVTRDPHTLSVWTETPAEEDQFFLRQTLTKNTDGPKGWSALSNIEIHKQVAGLARRLQSFGVGRGVPVAVLANTSVRWTAVDMAIQCLGGITVGLYPTLLPKEIQYQLAHSEAKLLIVEDEAQAQRCFPIIDELFDLQHILSLHTNNLVPQLTPAMPDLAWLSHQIEGVRIEDVCAYIYTSGTTGPPKAVVLNHHNFTSIIDASRARLPMNAGDRTVMFLPMAHVLQRFTQYRGLVDEAVGWFVPSIDALPQTIRIAKPHVMATVPRMLEKIRSQVERQAAEKGPHATQVLEWAIQVGRVVNNMRWRNHRVGWRLIAQQRIAERLVYTKIKEGLGGHLRLLICGGAPLSPELATWFEAIGISVREGWGLSETTAPATANGIEAFRFGSVGMPLDGTEVMVAEDGEILVRGPGIFQGYLKDDESTTAAFTEEGFFKTGDLGVIDEGFVSIVGRKKELIITASGKNIAPIPIEHAAAGGLIGRVIVVGDNRPYLTAILTPNVDVFTSRAETEEWDGTRQDWCKRDDVIAEIEQQILATNKQLARFANIKKWVLVPDEMDEASGLLTPTMKPKRNAIYQKYCAEIEGMYS